MEIRPMERADWHAVARVYAEGIATRQATFEVDVPTVEEFVATRLAWSRLVALRGEELVGWVAASRRSSRTCYRGVVEHSVYVAAAARGSGVGTALLRALVAAAGDAGVWTIETSIFQENAASVRLHERCGFRLVGRRERIARLDGVWRDTLLYELRLPDAPGD